MHAGNHPTGTAYSVFSSLDSLLRYARGYPYFVRWRGLSLGALPVRDGRGRLSYPVEHGEFCSTHHEFEAALDLGLISPDKVIEALVCENSICFDSFVNHYGTLKTKAKRENDTLAYLIAKLIQNSAYGKTATNPEHYKDWFIRTGDADPPGQKDADRGPVPFSRRWHPLFQFEGGEIYARPSTSPRYVDVALGASITGWGRATLLRAIAGSTDPVYCDTDSLICRRLAPDCEIDPYALGAWKDEGPIDRIAIAGKKLYAAWHQGRVVKVASKGFSVTGGNESIAKTILGITQGQKFDYHNEAPNFKLDGSARFTKRVIQSTF
jgi:hypothetical protein